MAGDHIIEFSGVHFSYNANVVLEQASFHIEEGESQGETLTKKAVTIKAVVDARLLPEELELVAADAMGDTISFYGDVIFISKDFGGTEVESWITAKAWLQFQRLLGPENVLNLRVGYRMSEKVSFSLALENVTDENYRIHGSGQNEAGRNFVAAFVVDW